MIVALDTCLQNLRYVSKDMPVESRDLNLRVDCLKALRDVLKIKATELGCPSEKVDPLVDELDAVLAKIRYVWSGDVIQPEDHNYIVDALKKARDILGEIESYCSGLKDQLDKCKSDLDACRSDLADCLKKIETALSVPIAPPLPPTTEPEIKAEITPPLPPTTEPEVRVITTWNEKGIEVQVS